MVGSADAFDDSVAPRVGHVRSGVGQKSTMKRSIALLESASSSPAGFGGDASSSPVVPFLVGAAVGGVAGAVAGALLSGYTSHLLAAVINIADRRSSRDDERLKFEFLLQ